MLAEGKKTIGNVYLTIQLVSVGLWVVRWAWVRPVVVRYVRYPSVHPSGLLRSLGIRTTSDVRNGASRPACRWPLPQPSPPSLPPTSPEVFQLDSSADVRRAAFRSISPAWRVYIDAIYHVTLGARRQGACALTAVTPACLPRRSMLMSAMKIYRRNVCRLLGVLRAHARTLSPAALKHTTWSVG